MGEPITEEALRKKLLGADRTSEEKRLGAYGQRPELELWAYDNGFEIVGYVFENGVLGGTPVLLRDDLVAAIRRIRDEDLAGIIWPSTDRQARDDRAFEAIRHAMQHLGKHCFVGVGNTFRDVAGAETPTQRRERRLLEMEAEKARTQLLLDAQRARRAKIARGGYGGGFLKPAWFQDRVPIGDDGADFAPNSHRLQWAIWMRERHEEGWSDPQIARELQRLEVRTTEGGPWWPRQVLRVRRQLAAVPPEILAIWTQDAGTGRRPAWEAVAW